MTRRLRPASSTGVLPIDLVTLDAFRQFTLEPADLETVGTRGPAVARLLAPAFGSYLEVKEAANRTDVTMPDVVAVMYALDRTLGRGRSGLVRVITDSSPALGQTIMGFDPWERVSLAVPRAEVSRLAARRHAEPGFDSDAALDAAAARVPDNADVVLEVDPARMRSLFMEALARG